jgi:Flp pilus assembly protein TadD
MRLRAERAALAGGGPDVRRPPRLPGPWAALLVVALGCAPAAENRAVGQQESVRQLRTRARAAHELGHAEEAVRLLQEAVELRPADPELWNDLGLALEESGDGQAAVGAYETAIRTDPRLAEPHLNLAILLMRRGISGRARTEFAEAVQADPANPLVYQNYGAALVDVGKPEQAREYLQRALELDPAMGPAHAELGRVEALAGRAGAAIQCFEAAGQLGVSSPAFHANYGLALLQSGMTQRAEVQLQRAAELDSTRARTWSDLGVARLRLGQAPQAVEAFRHAHALAPGDEDVRFNLANTLVQLERFSDADRLLRTPPPTRADLLGVWGMALRGLGRGSDALEALRQAAARAPRDTNILNNYGVVLAENGDVPGALEVWRRVLGIEPTNAVARQNILARGGELPRNASGKD